MTLGVALPQPHFTSLISMMCDTDLCKTSNRDGIQVRGFLELTGELVVVVAVVVVVEVVVVVVGSSVVMLSVVTEGDSASLES